MGNTIKELKPQTISYILLAFFSGVLFSIITTDIVLKKDTMSLFEILSIFANLAAVIIAVIAIRFTVLNLKSQKNQWLNESFIKHEAEVLLSFRKKLDVSYNSISFFLNNLLSIDKKYGYIPDAPPVIKYDELKKHFNTLVELNDFYNSNQNIFRKHQLEKKMECITLLLEPARYLPSVDINYVLLESKNNHQTYRMEQKVLAQIISFNFFAHNLHDVNPNKPESLDQMNKYNQLDKITEFNRLKELTSQEINSLVFKLDELTTYVDSINHKSLNVRQMRFFQKK